MRDFVSLGVVSVIAAEILLYHLRIGPADGEEPDDMDDDPA